MIEIIDNFLHHEEAEKIQNIMIGDDCNFPWFFNPYKLHINESREKENYQFTHSFLMNEIKSQWCYILFPILTNLDKKFKNLKLLRIKSNLTTLTNKKFEYDFHVDDENEKVKAAIYYVNTNDGETKFINKKCVSSIFNRLLVFNANELHKATTCTDQSVRCVINFNFTHDF